MVVALLCRIRRSRSGLCLMEVSLWTLCRERTLGIASLCLKCSTRPALGTSLHATAQFTFGILRRGE